MALALMGLVLYLVAEGYLRLARLDRFSEGSSRKVELLSAIQVVTDEISTAFRVNASNPGELILTRVDPTLNLTYEESRQRLPWLWPPPGSVSLVPLAPQRDPYNVEVHFRLESSTGFLLRDLRPVRGNTSQASSTPVIFGLSSFSATRSGPRVDLEVRGVQQDSLFHVSVYLPVKEAP